MNTHLRNIISIGLLFASVVGSSGAWAVDCPQSQYYITTQAEVDAFPQDCDSVVGGLTVNSNAITNIDGLFNLTSVGGDLDIVSNTSLTNLDGLANLTSVGGDLDIQGNASLTNLDGLASLTSVGGSLIIQGNTSLTNLDGLANLTSVVGDLDIQSNTSLTNLDGLASLTSLTSVGGSLIIQSNASLTSINGLANLTSVGGDLVIGGFSIFGSSENGNPALTNLDGLASLTSVGGRLIIESNASLTSINGLANLTSVESLSIVGNDSLTNIDGLANITSLGGGLFLGRPPFYFPGLYFPGRGNQLLTNLDGLANLTSVGGSLNIYGNDALTNLDGLANLTSVGGDLSILNNYGLTNCQSIAPVLGWPSGPPDDSVDGSIDISQNNGTECDSIEAVLASVSGPSQPVINTATGGNGNISLGFSPSTTTSALFLITRYEAACTGPNVNLNEAPNTPLLDNTPIQRTLTVNGYDPTSVAALIEVAIDITHSDPTHLVITLTSPAGTVLTLWDRGSSGGENLAGTFSTTLNSVDSLSLVAQESMDGDWVLTVEDVKAGPLVREGVLNSWGIKLTEQLTANSSDSPVTVNNLINGREYACTVAPVTNLGAVPLSNAVNATPVAGTVDCSQNDYVLNTQAEVAAFPQGCDVAGSLSIQNGFDITNLNSLSNLTSVLGNVDIGGNNALTNLDRLSNLTSVGGDLSIYANSALTNCQGLAPVLGWPNGPPDDSVGGGIGIEANGGTECESVEVILASVSGPSQPVINTAIVRDESISLAFSLSTTLDVLFPILGYESVCTGLTEIETAQGVGSPITVGNLTNYREYDCTVAPVTGLGTLPLSSSVSAAPTPESQVPIAPQITNIESGNAQVSVSVSVADDGGSPITGYTAYCFGGTLAFSESPTSPITVFGLTNGQAYVCATTATNNFGTSPASEPSAPVTPAGPPSAPQIAGIDPGDNQVSINVSVADDGGSPITSYTAACFANDFLAIFGTSPTSPITVSGLTNGQAYACLATATNDVGSSPISAPSAPVTPVAPPPGC